MYPYPNGPFGNMMPYSNFHGMNLDWVIQIAKDFLDQYTHIQELIEDKTSAGLSALDEEATRLQGLLDAWYDTHSQDIADQLTEAIASFQQAAQAAGAAVLETIPEDYTALSAAVVALRNGAIYASSELLDNNNLTSVVSTGDLNDLTGSAKVYYCNGLTSANNQPMTTMTGELVIIKYHPTRKGGTTQVFFSNNGALYYRTSHGAESNVTWEVWTRFYEPAYLNSSNTIINNSNYLAFIPSGDMNNLYEEQKVYYVSGLTDAINMPTTIMNGMFMIVKFNPASPTGLMQIYYGNDGSVFFRTSHGASLAWDRWRQVGAINNDSTIRIFRKVVCCGDSYTSGYIVDSSNNVNRYNEAYSWPFTLQRMTGNRYINCGVSGANCSTWLTNQRGLMAARLAGKSQAYILSLGLNDASTDASLSLDLGTSDDIGQDRNTYYGRYSQIIRELAAISPDAHIFCTTIPETASQYEGYNEAVRNIVTAYEGSYHVHLVDLFEFIDLYKIRSITSDKRAGHYTAIGYEQFGEILCRVISRTINNNLSDFIDVNLIPFDSEPCQSAVSAILDNITTTAIQFENQYIDAVGKYGVLADGKIAFSVFIRMKTGINSGVNSILTQLPAPADTNILIYEHDVGDVIRPDRFLTYTASGWRLNSRHTAGEYCFYYGVYTP